MQGEAAQAGSSGIVGVTVEVNNHVWVEHATEFLVTGTATDASPMSTGSPRPRRSPRSLWGSTARQPTFRACGTRSERWTHLHRRADREQGARTIPAYASVSLSVLTRLITSMAAICPAA